MSLFSRKIKAGMLPLTVALSLVIASVCAAMIIVSYYYRLNFTKFEIQERLRTNAGSGIAYLMGQPELFEYEAPYYLDLFGEGNDSLEVTKKRWGFYEVVMARAFQGRHQVEKAAVLGYKPTDKGRSALYLSDERRPLSIAGNTLIKGDAYLPQSGIRTTYINRLGYSKKELIYGKQYESAEGLPPINQELFQHISTICSQQLDASQMIAAEFLNDTIEHSFFKATLLYSGEERITLTQYIKGNVIIHSPVGIIVGAEAMLEDVLITAPYIEVQEGFQGQVQLFAGDSILLERNCKLLYPSCVAVFNQGEKAGIDMKNNALVQGIAFLDGASNKYEERIMQIGEKATILGQIYSNGFVENKGIVKGNLTCRKFLLKLDYSVYENHLFNGVIDSSLLPDYYLGTDLWEYQNRRSVIKWLN